MVDCHEASISLRGLACRMENEAVQRVEGPEEMADKTISW